MATIGQPPRVRAGERPPKFASWIYWIGISLAVVCFAANFIVTAYRGALLALNAHVAGIAILLVGIGITTLCVILWIGHVTGIRPISGRIAWGIWITLIVSFLGTTAAAYKTILILQPPVAIEKLVLLDESTAAPSGTGNTLNDLTVRNNNYYTVSPATKTKPSDVVIAFGAVVSGFQRDGAGNFDVRGRVTLSSAGGELEDVGSLPPANNEDYFKQRPIIQKFGLPKVEQVLGSAKGKIFYIQVLAKFPAAVLDKGPKILKIEINDAISGSCSEATQSLEFR